MNKEIPTILTIRQFAEKHKFTSEGGLRDQIFHAKTNGLKKAKVIVKIGRRVLINEKKYFNWLGV